MKYYRYKFPKTFNFEEVAKTSGVRNWKDVVSSPEYKSLKDEDKAAVRKQYFESIIKPNIHPDFVREAKTAFLKPIRSDKNESSISPD